MTKTIFLDRDGVINELVGPEFNRGPRIPSELVIRADFRNFMAQVSHLPINFVVVTNQPDISRGKLIPRDNEEIKVAILRELPEGTLYLECPHDNSDECICRKPKNGMIEVGIKKLAANRNESILIGDSWSDIQAGQSSRIYSILLQNNRSYARSSQGKHPADLKPNLTIKSLVELVEDSELRF